MKDECVGKQLFDNPLRREFLPLEEVARFFNHTETWVMHKVNEGVLPCYSIGRKLNLFHVADIRNAILQNALALQGGDYDPKGTKKKQAVRLRGKGQEERPDSLQELRERKRG